ncbi:glycosyltransferase family 4 protein, partial [Aquabacterium sp.]|uniref:glycosyltransferase family 4 protein n=1 Tax=Aquabacterium sp. TaxID=1872578 RepID=UPI00272C5A3E
MKQLLRRAYPDLTSIPSAELLPEPRMHMKRLPVVPPWPPGHVSRPLAAHELHGAPPQQLQPTDALRPDATLEDVVAAQTALLAALPALREARDAQPSTRNGRSLIVFLPWLVIGGAEKFALNVIAEFTALGWHATVVLSLDSTGFGGNRWEQVARTYTDDIFVVPSMVDRHFYGALVCNLVASRGVEAAIATNSAQPYLFLPYFKAACPINTFIDVSHNWIDAWIDGGYTAFGLGFMAEMDYSMAISDVLRRKMVAEGGDESKLRTIYIGTNATFFTHTPVADRAAAILAPGPAFLPEHRDAFAGLLARGNKRVVVFVGRMSGEKQPHVFVDAIVRARASLPPGVADSLAAVMVGGGYMLDNVQAHIAAAGAGGFLMAVGPLDEHGTRDILNVADIMMMTSETEGTPLALFEAMSMGLACIAPAVGGIPEMLTVDTGHLVVNTGLSQDAQADAFAAALVKLLSMPEDDVRGMGAAAAVRVREKFDTRIMAQQLQGLMDDNRHAAATKRSNSGGISLGAYLQALRLAS